MKAKLCRFQGADASPRIGLIAEEQRIVDLSSAGVNSLTALLEAPDLETQLNRFAGQQLPAYSLDNVRLLTPVEQQEVWAAGVTYLRSKNARMEESDFSANAYDRVYEAPRPELFFKCLPEKVVGPNETVGIRADARWNVPEPELALVINSRGEVAGYTIGNDMSSRDIEGENLLYLPQAKVYERSCAVGPCLVVGAGEAEARSWKISLEIRRAQTAAFAGETTVSQIKRPFDELVQYLCRSQKFPHGAVLLTGTGVVPPDSFTLQADDIVTIDISGIGKLSNRVEVV